MFLKCGEYNKNETVIKVNFILRQVVVVIIFCFFIPEMRKKFDSGEDPLDPENQQGEGGQHFHRSWNQWQGFNPFGSGGPFNFKFHFN